jgi:hypothetical protein
VHGRRSVGDVITGIKSQMTLTRTVHAIVILMTRNHAANLPFLGYHLKNAGILVPVSHFVKATHRRWGFLKKLASVQHVQWPNQS